MMTVAMPVKTAKEDTAISPLFGHAKYFAFAKDGKIVIEKNPYDGGTAVVDWLLDKGVDVVVTQHIGLKPYILLAQNGVECYYPGEGRVIVKEALENMDKMEKITESNIEKFARHSHKH